MIGFVIAVYIIALSAALRHTLPPPPYEGLPCPCAGVEPVLCKQAYVIAISKNVSFGTALNLVIRHGYKRCWRRIRRYKRIPDPSRFHITQTPCDNAIQP